MGKTKPLQEIILRKVDGIRDSWINDNGLWIQFSAEVITNDVFKTIMIASIHDHVVSYGRIESTSYEELVLTPEQ